MFSFKQQLPRLTLAAALVIGLCPALTLAADAASPVFTFDIANGPLDEVLLDISRQTGVPISFSQNLVQGKRSAAIRGALGSQQAVEKALQGSGLQVDHSEQGLTVHQAPVAAKVSAAAAPASSADYRMEKVTVTGSRIARSQTDGATPVNVITHEEMEARGYKNVYDALATQTQNTVTR